MADLSLSDFSSLKSVIEQLGDNFFWNPIYDDADAVVEFERLIASVEESQSWPPERNWEKGRVLEDFSVFLFERFQGVKVRKNRRPGDNEMDVETVMNDAVIPSFMAEYIGQKIVCECKNKKSSAVDVGMVAKLAELLGIRGSRFGVFISILGLSGTGWKFGEGKRKKILIKDGTPIISFKFETLKNLRTSGNFYTMIKQKVNALYDEIDDNSPEVPQPKNDDYTKQLLNILDHFLKIELISSAEKKDIEQRVVDRYGIIANE